MPHPLCTGGQAEQLDQTFYDERLRTDGWYADACPARGAARTSAQA